MSKKFSILILSEFLLKGFIAISIIAIIGTVTASIIKNCKNDKVHYSSYHSTTSTYDYSPANSLRTLDGNMYSKSSYDYYLDKISLYCKNTKSDISDITCRTQKLIEKDKYIKPSLMEILKGFAIAVTNDKGIVFDLKEVAAVFIYLY